LCCVFVHVAFANLSRIVVGLRASGPPDPVWSGCQSIWGLMATISCGAPPDLGRAHLIRVCRVLDFVVDPDDRLGLTSLPTGFGRV
jgi:hypothetical protein